MFGRGRDKRASRKPPRQFLDRPISYILEALIVFGLIAGFAYAFRGYAAQAACFRVKTIRVEGADIVPDEAIIARSGLTDADNVLFLDPGAVRERIESMPFVQSCRVARVFPDKVRIAVKERAPVATLLVNNRSFELDREGTVLRELGPGAAHTGPFITNVADVSSVTCGERLPPRALLAALAVWDAFRSTSMAREVTVSEISAAQENRICMYCDEFDFEIRWGREDFERQAWKLDVLWRAQNRRLSGKEYVDLRFGNDIACK